MNKNLRDFMHFGIGVLTIFTSLGLKLLGLEIIYYFFITIIILTYFIPLYYSQTCTKRKEK